MCNTHYNDINNKAEVTILKKEELLAGFLQEMRRGTIIMCVLAKLRQSAYGYNLIAELAESGIPIEANTLYPLLRRLELQGLLESSWNTTDGAKPRKYYETTDLGKNVLAELKTHWQQAAQNLNNILED
jgi:DNA-binding PadR family transcriptional regulator